MDAVYVHIAKNYYEKGLASWTDPDQLAKIVENANVLEPILVGKTAPDIKAQIINIDETIKRKDNPDEHKRFVSAGTKTLHSVDKKYTVLFVWDPDCGHCKKSMPDIVKFYEEYKDKVEVYAICNKTYKDLPECAQYIKDNIPVNWINIMDPYLQSRYKQNYDVNQRLRLFVLDENKKIISKKLGTEQLAEVIDRHEKIEAEKEGSK
jgi:AhpC/TSA family.